jgi:hypothetical protein
MARLDENLTRRCPFYISSPQRSNLALFISPPGAPIFVATAPKAIKLYFFFFFVVSEASSA